MTGWLPIGIAQAGPAPHALADLRWLSSGAHGVWLAPGAAREPVEARLRRHAEYFFALQSAQPLVPARPVLVADDAARLSFDAARIDRQLERLGQSVEVIVRLAAPWRAAEPTRATAPSAYLRARAAEREAERAWAADVRAGAAALLTSLEPFLRAPLIERPPKQFGPTSALTLHALIARENCAAAIAQARPLMAGVFSPLDASLSGPWPPLSFTDA
jgi:hypothetical protein